MTEFQICDLGRVSQVTYGIPNQVSEGFLEEP
jgi:hypothetical protein